MRFTYYVILLISVEFCLLLCYFVYVFCLCVLLLTMLLVDLVVSCCLFCFLGVGGVLFCTPRGCVCFVCFIFYMYIFLISDFLM